MKLFDWQEQWHKTKIEWRDNRRLQVIVFVALAIFILWLHIQLNDWRLAKRSAAYSAERGYNETQLAVREKSWIDRSKAADRELARLNSRVWRASSEGEAQALFRDWLDSEARQAGLAITRSNLAIGEAMPGTQLRPVRADIQGRYVAGAWQQLLLKIRDNERVITVDYEQLNVTTDRNQLYRLNLTAWFELTTARDEAAR